MTLKHTKNFLRAALCCAAALPLSSGTGFAQESWMTQRQQAAASQQNLERLADQARQRNSPGQTTTTVAQTPDEVRAAQQSAQKDLDRAEAQRQHAQDERAAIQSQRQLELEKRYREVDDWATAAKERGYQEIDARHARRPAVRALLEAGPTSATLTAYCDAVEDFTQNRFIADPVLAIQSIERALEIDDRHSGCWMRYSQLLNLLRPGTEPLRYFKLADYSQLGFIPRNQDEAYYIIDARYGALSAAIDRRQYAVATYIDSARRVPALQMPERMSNWNRLRSMRTPEARYWQSRVHRLGLLGQPVNAQASLEASCSKEGESFFRNRLNCMIQSTPPGSWTSANLTAFKALVDTVVEPRHPKNFLRPEQKALMAEITTRRADRAIGLAIYANLAFNLSATGPGTIGLSPETRRAEQVKMHYREEACKALEEAVSMGYYDNGPDVFTLLQCYDVGYIPAPTGARARIVAVLESEGNVGMKTYVLDPLK